MSSWVEELTDWRYHQRSYYYIYHCDKHGEQNGRHETLLDNSATKKDRDMKFLSMATFMRPENLFLAFLLGYYQYYILERTP